MSVKLSQAHIEGLTQGRVNPYDEVLEPENYEDWFRGFIDRYDLRSPIMRSHGGHRHGKKRIPYKLAVFDFETDPFAGPGSGRIEPFVGGYFDGDIYREFWGDDCAERLVEHIKGLDHPVVAYAHNGGKFDFTFMIDKFEPRVFTIGTRIVRAWLQGNKAPDNSFFTHQVRDSWSIIQEPLRLAADKLEFDYKKMARGKRDRHKKQISEYLKQDCLGLYNVVKQFREAGGDALTMASVSIKRLNQSMLPQGAKHGTVYYDRLTEEEDTRLRPFYYGGRVECFRSGILDASWKLFDITNSYGNVMRNMQHPIGNQYKCGLDYIGDHTDFAVINATSHGALPIRDPKNGKLNFPHVKATFNACGHEIRMGIKLGLLEVHDVIDARECTRRSSFADFIDEYMGLRSVAKANYRHAQNVDDREYWQLMDKFYKRVINSSYGKFSQNPRKFKDTLLLKNTDPAPQANMGWKLNEIYENMDVYTRPSNPAHWNKSFINVATGASITSAARANLLLALNTARNPIYCDTDSIICEELPRDLLGDTLGKWKLEAEGNRAIICERKMYCLLGKPSGIKHEDEKRIKEYGDVNCVKLASKGVRLKVEDIIRVAQGGVVEYTPLAPTIKIDGSQIWTTRKIRMQKSASLI